MNYGTTDPWAAIRQAVDDARRINIVADRYASSMAATLVGRLRCVESSAALAALKHELRDFNTTTGEWE